MNKNDNQQGQQGQHGQHGQHGQQGQQGQQGQHGQHGQQGQQDQHEWNNHYCMAIVNLNKNNQKKCSFKSFGSNDFCKKHIDVGKYDIATLTRIKTNDMTKFKLNDDNVSIKPQINSFDQIMDKYYSSLDNKFNHNLLGIYDSWKDVDLKYHIKIDNEYWPIDILINHFGQQLNNSNMESQYPIYPSNPFTRKTFSIDALLKIKNRIKILKLRVNVALKILLNAPEKTLTKICKDASDHTNRHSQLITKYLDTYLRFKLINCKNSQFNYVGYWVRKITPLSSFECIYHDYRNIPYQVYDSYHNTLISNPYRHYVETVINKSQAELFDINNDVICELL